ncbi:SDR family NAD(P)-dependent oxidoreductase [Roseomonas sp. HF4]|uniref:SDR family NAD(P)-dependent oxidoreductase n=1 Tax=Roseomonas sp. HF4 TaxID=2562313 RepID=UPI0019802467|nr:SDR family NAD(P)-dependent oxidoreductase [Roseomonas sp. HF4]
MTGGNSGIGLATVRRFAAEGARVFVTGWREAEFAGAVTAIRPNAMGIQADPTRSADLDRLYEQVKHRAC